MTYKTSGFSVIRRRARFIAAFFALNLLFEVIAPLKLWALTGGPSQPEVTSFEPVGTTEMVDLFTGDFTYNIPLFDVGGYPVNISYHAGISMDQEASWVGLGWNINPGAINRGMRGVPDDFLSDEVEKKMNLKEQKTLALKFNTDLEIFGFAGQKKRNGGKDKANSYSQFKTMNKLSKFELGFGVVYNNYKGIGYSLDLSGDISKTTHYTKDEYDDVLKNSKFYADDKNKDFLEAITDINSRSKEKNIDEERKKLNDNIKASKKFLDQSGTNQVIKKPSKIKKNLSFSANSQDGFSGGLSFSKNLNEKRNHWTDIVPQIGLGYNSLLGVSSFDAGISASREYESYSGGKTSYYQQGRQLGTFLPIGNYSYVPNIHMSTLSTSNSFNATVGFDAFGGHPDMRFSGFYNTEALETNHATVNAYGYLYEQESYWNRGSDHVMMDFNREKESNGNKNATHLPLSNHTYDVYSVSGQGTGGIYRPHRKTIGLIHDPYSRNRNKQGSMNDIGLELGFGSNFHLGINYKNKVQKSSTGLWMQDNGLLNLLNYRMGESNDPDNKRHKQTYFKAAGEQTPSDLEISDAWGGKKEVALKIGKTNGTKRNLRFGKVETNLQSGGAVKGYTENNPIRSNVISYLTAEECSQSGLGVDPYIISYPQNYWTNYISKQTQPALNYYHRYGGDNGARAHHISEIISNSGDGMRYVYGLPAYNAMQKEVNFAVSKDYVSHPNQTLRSHYPDKGLVKYSPSEQDNTVGNQRGQDNFFMSTQLPAYAHSYLLTGVLSPDYADLTGDGITDDDYGSAVKFNYYKTPELYQWRTPYEQNQANLDEGYITDNADNKGYYVYGKKEIWYVQSMESKTHIAEFKLSARHDGHGVLGENGGRSTSESNTLMKLDSIVIYSKIDLLANGKNAVPVKTIVFQYDYSLCPGIPNSDNSTGKLTLKSIYFTYGTSGKGVLNPYKFTYSDFNPAYSHVHYDRWGNYKYADEKLPNRYFPYLDYDKKRDTLDKYATAWNLNQVELPSGGKINVQYEADDYAYVQDKKAMQMMKVVSASDEPKIYYYDFNSRAYLKDPSKPNPSTLYEEGKNNNYLFFKLRESPSDIPDNNRKGYLQDNYLRDENGEILRYIYYRFKVNMDPKAKGVDHFEYVPGYAEIEYDKCGITSDEKHGFIKLKDVSQGDVGLTKCNPIAKQAWQMGLQSLRKVMYPGSDLSQEDGNGDRQSAIKALVNSFGQSLNIFTGPYQNLRWKHIAKNFEINKSYIRLYNPNQFKVGGGCRVKKIIINDNWNSMDTDQESGQYGQEFSYVTKTGLENNTGAIISSGVASYEPFIGGDENPFRAPSFYKTNRFMFPDLNNYIEEPFGESFFPSATVGYSRVVVRNIPKPGAVVTSTGKVVHEFFTAKDFPVITSNTPLRYLKNGGGTSSDDNKPGRKKAKKFVKALVSMFNVVKRDYMVASQGYSIILNDMHGKPKSTAIYSALDESLEAAEKQFTGRLVSGTEYKYKTETSKNDNSFSKVFELADTSRFKSIPKGSKLNNTVWVMKENGQLEQKEIATSYDIAVDTRESKSNFRHAGLDFNLEQFAVMVVPCPQPKYLVTQSLFQSAVVTKVIQQYGVLEEVVAYDHSSIVKTKNLVWDEQTGQVLLTATTNEFEDPIYNYTYPAHLVYDGMGPAYKNIDYETGMQILSNGDVDMSFLEAESNFKFVPGDELLMRNGIQLLKGWVLKTEMNTSTGVYNRIRIIDINGQPVPSGLWNVRIIRSGRRNLASVPVGAITTMNKNIYNYLTGVDSTKRLNLKTDIVQSSAAIFSDQWQGYVQKASYLTRKCDTLSVSITDLYHLVHDVIKTGNASAYTYSATMPPAISTLDAYTGTLKRTLETYARGAGGFCGDGYKVLSSVFFGTDSTDHQSHCFKARYVCTNSNDTFIQNMNCCLIIKKNNPLDSLELNTLDSIGNFVRNSSDTASFTGYRNGITRGFKMIFTAKKCFEHSDCYYIRDCSYTAGKNINPYVNNARGVWRQKEAYAYNSTRVYANKANNNTNIRKDGLIENYQPFWKFKTSTSANGLDRNTSGASKWVSTGQATMYAPEGNGLEEKDALGIYSSQLFGYNNLLVTAQAGNARNCQIAFDGFEDYYSPLYGCVKEGHFDFKAGLNLSYPQKTLYNTYNAQVLPYIPTNPGSSRSRIVKDTSHTGLYSLRINANDSHRVTRKTDYSGLSFTSANDSLFRFKTADQLITSFAPTPGKYVISGWLYEKLSDINSVNNYTHGHLNVKVYDGGSAVVNLNINPSGMIIERWQRMDGVFTIPTGADSIRITLVNTGSVPVYFDDIRVHPFDAKMAGHVYHYTLLKVMAELDDNNYATFYEYDDEGSLVRVKRETEKGIVTIQESRKSIRKKTP